MNIYISDEQNKLDKEIIEKFEEAFIVALKLEFKECQEFEFDELPIELCVSIVSKSEIQKLNKEFRNIDKVTDVLSFPQLNNNEELKSEIINRINKKSDINVIVGDVVICFEKAVEQANEYETGLERELVYLFVHSIFHLFGYDHMNEMEKNVMREKEERVMEDIGL